MASNLKSLDSFLRKWQPPFSGHFSLNEFHFVDPLKRMSVSRTSGSYSPITNTHVSLLDNHIPIADGHLGIEEALSLALVTPFDFVSGDHFNVYKLLRQTQS
jgi:hypothetical protein